MGRHLSYAKYVIRHRWFVFIACCSHGIPLRGLLHDLSKLLPSEWFPYARYFYNRDGSKRTIQDGDTAAAFDIAWLLHQNRNRHHWQFWILSHDDGGTETLRMPNKYVLEMFCDWQGAGRAQGVENWRDVRPWYEKNHYHMRLHPDTEVQLECLMLAEDVLTLKTDKPL